MGTGAPKRGRGRPPGSPNKKKFVPNVATPYMRKKAAAGVYVRKEYHLAAVQALHLFEAAMRGEPVDEKMLAAAERMLRLVDYRNLVDTEEAEPVRHTKESDDPASEVL